MDEIATQEHEKWIELCQALKAIGAVTDEDLQSRASLRDTPGQRLFALIREWGDLRALCEYTE